jgi:hypothetical protein
MQLDAAFGKLHALEDTGQYDAIYLQAALLSRLECHLTKKQASLIATQATEQVAIDKANRAATQVEVCDKKAERLRMTADSLAQGVTQMVEVRSLRAELLAIKQRSAVLREVCQHKRKEAQSMQSQVRLLLPD